MDEFANPSVMAIWRTLQHPKGYKMLAHIILDPSTDKFFIVYASLEWLRSASHEQRAKALAATVESEFLKNRTA